MTENNVRTQRIGVLMGGMSAERDVSLQTGSAILRALLSMGYTAVPIDVDTNITATLAENSIDIAFIALHGILGEDGTIQGLLEVAGIPYTGSGVLASAVAINKVTTKKLLAYHDLPTPAFQFLSGDESRAAALAEKITMDVPLVIKPAEEGSTLGISIVREKGQLPMALVTALQRCHEVLIEEFIAGREITAAVLNGSPLPLIEIKPKSGFYDYESKYTAGETEYIVAPDLDPGTAENITALAVRTYEVIGCCGAARVDFILTADGTPYILEINTIPGMTETSLLPKAAGHAGMTFNNLVEKILLSAKAHKKIFSTMDQ